jgi:hypothetical protein
VIVGNGDRDGSGRDGKVGVNVGGRLGARVLLRAGAGA